MTQAVWEAFAVFLKELENRLKASIPRIEYKIYLDRNGIGMHGRVWCSWVIMYAQENGRNIFRVKKKIKGYMHKKEIAISLKDYPWYKLPPKQAILRFL